MVFQVVINIRVMIQIMMNVRDCRKADAIRHHVLQNPREHGFFETEDNSFLVIPFLRLKLIPIPIEIGDKQNIKAIPNILVHKNVIHDELLFYTHIFIDNQFKIIVNQ